MILAHAERRDLDRDHVALDLYEGKCQANAQRIECSGLGEIFHGRGRRHRLGRVSYRV